MMSFDEAFDISLGEVVDATVESVEQGSLDPLIDLFTGGDDSDGDSDGGSSGGGGSTPAVSSQGRRDHDYYGEYNFVVRIDGEDNKDYGAFQKCDGLSWETDLIEWRDSMDPYPRYRPGIRRFGKIKLTKGFVNNTKLWDWCQSVMKGKHDRKNGVIHLLNDDGDDGSPAVSYKFIDAFPIKWSGFKLDGKGSAGLVEEVELVVECVERE
jgi:phage tail-like protein